MGNITNDGSRTYSWVEGRNLRQINLADGRVVKCYDHEGTRYRRDVVSADGASTYSYYYTYHGKKLMHLRNMHFFYDADGKPCQVNRGGTIYNYVLNLQGDVVGLTDTSGNLVVEYKYDAWGKLLGISGSLATSLGTANPLRYRGYVYDNETGLYYLHSRYYDPEMRRFISVDDIEFIAESRSAINERNLYAYCDNNPIQRVDYNGQLWMLAGAIVGVLTQYAFDVAYNMVEGMSFIEALKSPQSSLVDYGAAALSGALAATGIGTAASIIANSAISGMAYLVNADITETEVNIPDLCVAVGAGALSGIIGGRGANVAKLRGVTKVSKTVWNTAVSPKKIAMYSSKIAAANKDLTLGVIRTIAAGILGNGANKTLHWVMASVE